MEDISILVEKIAKEVLKRIESRSHKTLLIGQGKLMKEELDKASICFEYHEDYCDDMAIDSYDFIIIEGITNFQLVSSALLVPGTNVSKLILKARLEGKNIYIENDSMEYKKYEATMDKGLRQKLMSYEDSLKDYGVRIWKAEEIIKAVKNLGESREEKIGVRSQKADIPKGFYRLDKKLITEQDLRKLKQQGHTEIEIGNKSLITPLAKDYMKINNICLRKE